MPQFRRGVKKRTQWQAVLAVAALASAALAGLRAAQVAPYDLVLRNARIVDGTGSPWFRADIGIRGDTIARIAPSIDGPASRTIDVGQQVVAPGFIDIHSHAARGIFEIPTADNYVRQGVTTLLAGPDGSSPSQSLRFWRSSRRCTPPSTSGRSSARARFGPR